MQQCKKKIYITKYCTIFQERLLFHLDIQCWPYNVLIFHYMNGKLHHTLNHTVAKKSLYQCGLATINATCITFFRRGYTFIWAFSDDLIMYPHSITWMGNYIIHQLQSGLDVITTADLGKSHKAYTDQTRHVRNEVSALPDTRDKLARV